ncbi:MAG: sulfite exporter TauE/SafE family protein [Dissulfurispiraceae bacterium]
MGRLQFSNSRFFSHPRWKWVILSTVLLGVTMLVLNVSVVNAAMLNLKNTLGISMAAGWLFLLGCSLSGSFLSSLLGIGGAIFIIPIILYFQNGVHLNLGIHQISALCTLFVFVAGTVGFWAHGRHGKVEKRLVIITGSSASIGALSGGIVQFYLPHNVILTTFVSLLFLIGTLMIWPLKVEHEDIPEYSITKTVIGCLTGGFLAGIVGIGGGTILVPFMIRFLKIPTRPAITTGLALVMLAGFFSLIGRLEHASSVPWMLGIPLLLGILPGSLLGAYTSHRMPTTILRKGFAVMILMLAVRTAISVV